MIAATDNTIAEYYSNGFILLNMNILNNGIITDSTIHSLSSFVKGKINEINIPSPSIFISGNEVNNNINTGTLNNLTLSQQEEMKHKAKNYEFNKTSTYIGDIATIESNNTNSNIIINADQDINILGGNILANTSQNNNQNSNNTDTSTPLSTSLTSPLTNGGNSSNITLQAGNNINISTIQDYEYERQYMKRKGGTFGETLEKENIDQSVKNIQSNISAGNNLTISTGNDLNSIGTNFSAGIRINHSTLEGESNEQEPARSSFGGGQNQTQTPINQAEIAPETTTGNITFNIGNDLNLLNAMDYVYDYDYEKREKFDIASALVNIAAAAAVGAATGGAGAAAMAGLSAAASAAGMTKGSLDIEMNYDETIVSTTLTGDNININVNNNATLVSTDFYNTDGTAKYLSNNKIIREDNSQYTIGSTLGNNNNDTNYNNTTTNEETTKLLNTNGINLNIGNNLSVSAAEERHEHQETHDTWGGDIGMAAVGGAITGLATGLGMQGGEYFGNMAGGLVKNQVMSSAINATVNSAITSYTSTIGNTMSSVAINGGSFKDILESGIDAAIDDNNLKNAMKIAMVSAAGKLVGEYIKKVKVDYNNSLTPEQINNNMTPIPVEESNLKFGSFSDNKIGINSYIKDGKIIQAGTENVKVNYWVSNQNRLFKVFNFLPGSSSFANFHDALNLSGIWNQLSIPPAYIISQFNAVAPYLKYTMEYNYLKNKNRK